MKNKLFVLVLVGVGAGLSAQETPQGQASPKPASGMPREAFAPPRRDMMPGLLQRSLSVRLLSRIISEDGSELWTNQSDKITIPGRPVAIKLMGNNLAVLVQFTPYLRGEQWVLVAQGQIWLQNEERGIHYETTLQTIPIKLGEPVYYFPLGARNSGGGDCIEICIYINPLVIEPDKNESESEPKSESK